MSSDEMDKKTVYVPMAGDSLHPGHLRVIYQAKKLGNVVLGLQTDAAIASFRRLPVMNYEERKEVFSNVKGVSQILPQESLDATENLLALRPDYLVHGDNWRTGALSALRDKAIKTMEQWGGEIVEIPYDDSLSSSKIVSTIRRNGTTPDIRRKTLRRLLKVKEIVRVIEVHNGLTGLIAENTTVEGEHGQSVEFDAMWESSLTDSTSKGKPDTSAVDVSSRMQTIDQILEVTTKPMIVDADNGGLTEHFAFNVKTLERFGVSAVIIEDKVGPKRNSLFGTEAGVAQLQDTIPEFSQKIRVGKKAQYTEEFMIIARIESLILKIGMEDALDRARAYVEAGADGIMIHSSEKSPDEIFEFCRKFRGFSETIPLVVVPSTYASVTERELAEVGVNIVIYANHLLRSAFPAMQECAKTILKNGRAKEASEHCTPIKEIISLIPESVI